MIQFNLNKIEQELALLVLQLNAKFDSKLVTPFLQQLLKYREVTGTDHPLACKLATYVDMKQRVLNENM